MEDILNEIIQKACEKLYGNDKYLIIHRVHERAIVFRFGLYLQELMNDKDCLKKYNLDNEYNKNMNDPKRLSDDESGKYPDLIIHKRGSNSSNLLIIEFKTEWNSDTTSDLNKIRRFVDVNGRYKYNYGLSIVFRKNHIDLLWIKDGQKDKISTIEVINRKYEGNLK